MPKHPFQIGRDRESAFDIVSYGRRGPTRPDRLAPEHLAQIARTVRRAPEVMVKVSGGGKTPGAVAAHFRYISRRGALEMETDDGERHQGRGVAAQLVEDWDLDLDAMVDRWNYQSRGGRTSQPKLVHNIVLSMPARTEPDRLLAASRAFAREEFALQHRYALVMHTDQDHPHVHLVVSAHRLDGRRLNIGKADLRRWREQFARQLRREGVKANATPAQLRGKLSGHRRDPVYRNGQRDESRLGKQPRQRQERPGTPQPGGSDALMRSPSTERILATATAVQQDWRETVTALYRQAEDGLASEVEQFRRSLWPPKVVPEDPVRKDGAPTPAERKLDFERTR